MSSSRTTTRRSDGGTVSHVSWLRRLPSYGDVVVAAVLSVLVQVNVWDVHFAHRLQFSLLALIMAGALLAVRWWPSRCR
jgi:hypothetical protein